MRPVQLLATLFLGLVLSACGQSKQTDHQNQTHQNVDAKEMHQLIQEKSKAVILDVRTEGELAGGMIPNAVHMDFYAEDFKEKLAQLDSDQPVFVYCAAGGRSGQAMNMMKELNFKEVYNLKGGFPTWMNAGMEVSR